MKRFLFKQILSLLLLGGVAYLSWTSVDVFRFLTTSVSKAEQPLIYTIQHGASVRSVAFDLAAKDYMRRPAIFVLTAKITGRANHIQAGEYEIDPQHTPLEVLTQFSTGRVKQYTLTVVEGWTFKQMLQAVNEHTAIRHTLKGLSPVAIMEKLGYAKQHPEGRFFPDTYHFPRGLSDVVFFRRAYQGMQRYLDEQWAKRAPNLPLRTDYEALILASIVEKESAVASERPMIAGVFVQRLRRGMRLQTDPTIIYGMGEAYQGNIRKKDLRRDGPYNTYTRSGLPPTPIALPSAAAIHATLHPAATKALYFVSRGDGSHQFSETLAQHRAAVVKYQLRRR